jgi:hypothetical protein
MTLRAGAAYRVAVEIRGRVDALSALNQGAIRGRHEPRAGHRTDDLAHALVRSREDLASSISRWGASRG